MNTLNTKETTELINSEIYDFLKSKHFTLVLMELKIKNNEFTFKLSTEINDYEYTVGENHLKRKINGESLNVPMIEDIDYFSKKLRNQVFIDDDDDQVRFDI